MNILIVSDTHGRLERAVRCFEKLNQEEKIDLLLHLGDYQRDANELQQRLAVPTLSVMGNCDGGMKRDFKVISTPSGKLLMTHGHMEGVNRDYQGLMYLAEENDCRIICFGHTHVPLALDTDGYLFINPGSLTYPRDCSAGSVALLKSTEDDLNAQIIYYDELFPEEFADQVKKGSTKKKKFRGGFLRGIMNYSDRL